MYRGIRLRFEYGFESCDVNGPRNVKDTNPAKQRPVFSFSPLLLVGSQESVLKVPKRGQFHAAIRVTPRRFDSCAQGALGRRTVSRRNFCDMEPLAKRYGKHATKQGNAPRNRGGGNVGGTESHLQSEHWLLRGPAPLSTLPSVQMALLTVREPPPSP